MRKRLTANIWLVVLTFSLLMSGCKQGADSDTEGTTRDSENVIQGTEKQTERTDSEIVNDALAFINPDNSMKTIPESYLKTINEAGRVERFEYVTSEGKNKHALVYLPYGYNEETKYDVIYWMHGGGGSAEWVLGTEGEKNELTLILDNLIANKDMRPVIFVAASFYPEEGADSSVATADRLVKLFPDEWSDDLVPALESHYSTYADSTDKADRLEVRNQRRQPMT